MFNRKSEKEIISKIIPAQEIIDKINKEANVKIKIWSLINNWINAMYIMGTTSYTYCFDQHISDYLKNNFNYMKTIENTLQTLGYNLRYKIIADGRCRFDIKIQTTTKTSIDENYFKLKNY